MSNANAGPRAALPPDTPGITGWSAVSPYGVGRAAFAAGVRAGAKTAVKADAALGTLPSPEVCTVPGFDIQELLGKRGTAKMDRLTALALVTSDGLLRDADGAPAVPTDDRTGVVLGITMGSLETSPGSWARGACAPTDMVGGMPRAARERRLKSVPLGRLGRAEEVAELVSFLVSDRAAYITRSVVEIHGGGVF
ncbi:SDR family oxidoreductase [Streptomyces sp. NPDC006309]|uniref:SDR family oxidoreductase n=1 Tax=Streptomyces sp. NPDC006309 TaxID=3156749 RepID=UPI0033B9146B